MSDNFKRIIYAEWAAGFMQLEKNSNNKFSILYDGYLPSFITNDADHAYTPDYTDVKHSENVAMGYSRRNLNSEITIDNSIDIFIDSLNSWYSLLKDDDYIKREAVLWNGMGNVDDIGLIVLDNYFDITKSIAKKYDIGNILDYYIADDIDDIAEKAKNNIPILFS